MGTPYVGEIRIFAGNFAPVGWLFCEGQLVSINEYETLLMQNDLVDAEEQVAQAGSPTVTAQPRATAATRTSRAVIPRSSGAARGSG